MLTRAPAGIYSVGRAGTPSDWPDSLVLLGRFVRFSQGLQQPEDAEAGVTREKASPCGDRGLPGGEEALPASAQPEKRSVAMPEELLTTREAARRLGISTASLYDWLSRSDVGEFVLRGQGVTINYLQTGAKGQGRIRIEASEVERLKDLMRVQPHPVQPRRPPTRQVSYPGIHVPLGRPVA